MLTLDLSAFDLPALERRVLETALRQDRCAREAASIGVSPDYRGTHRAITEAGADAETLADLARLVAVLRRAAADEGRPRPASVLRLVPAPVAPQPGIFERTMTLLGRPSPVEPRRHRAGARA